MLVAKEIKGKLIRIRWKNVNLDSFANEMYFIKYDSWNSVFVRFSSGVSGSVLINQIYFPDDNAPKNYIPRHENKKIRIFGRSQDQIEAMQGGKLKKM